MDAFLRNLVVKILLLNIIWLDFILRRRIHLSLSFLLKIFVIYNIHRYLILLVSILNLIL